MAPVSPHESVYSLRMSSRIHATTPGGIRLGAAAGALRTTRCLPVQPHRAYPWPFCGSPMTFHALHNSRHHQQPWVTSATAPGRGQARRPADPSSANNKIFQQKTSLQQFLGPISVIASTVHGHGLAASKTLSAGDLLLVTPPLAVVSAKDLESVDDEGEDDDVMDLKFTALQQKLMKKRYSAAELSWFNALTPAAAPDPEGAEAPAPPFQAGPLPDLQTLISQGQTKEQDDGTLPCSSSDPDFIERLIQVNAYEAASEDTDLAYVALGREPVQEVMGIWPHYSLLNHSCAPNTITYAHKSMLITRASRNSTSKGSELTTNYIGDMVHSPLDVRQEALEDTYGFVCECARCKSEGKMGDDLSKLTADIYEACTEQVREELEEAVAQEDTAALQGLRDQLAAFVEVLDAAFTKKKVPEQTQIWIQAGMFELYELLYTCLEALGQRDMRLMELLQALAAEVQPGSELHCFYSRRLVEAQEMEEEDAASSSEAVQIGPSAIGAATKHTLGQCLQAYNIRYGKINSRILQTILRTRRELEEGDDD